jgi:hypothetical protein
MESPLIITVVLLGFSIIIAQNENQKSSKNFWISVFFWVLTIFALSIILAFIIILLAERFGIAW